MSVCQSLEELIMYVSPEVLRVLTLSFTRSITRVQLRFSERATYSSLEYCDFLKRCGSQIEKFIVIDTTFRFDVILIIQILLECKNLKQLVICRTFIIIDDAVIAVNLPECIEKIKMLDLSEPLCLSSVNSDINLFLLEILRRMVNLEVLKVSYMLADCIFRNLLQGNILNSLKVIHVHDIPNMSEFSLEHFMNSANCLEKIVLKNCGGTAEFLRNARNVVRRNNSLSIECKVSNQYQPYSYWHVRPDGIFQIFR